MKSSKKIIRCLVLVLIFVFSLSAMSSLTSGPTAVKAKTTVSLNKSTVTLYTIEDTKLKVRGTKKSAQWKSSNNKVAEVNKKGKVTAKKAGCATITAKVAGKKLRCKVVVKNLPKIRKKDVNRFIKKYAHIEELYSHDSPSGVCVHTSKIFNGADVNHWLIYDQDLPCDINNKDSQIIYVDGKTCYIKSKTVEWNYASGKYKKVTYIYQLKIQKDTFTMKKIR